MPLRTLIPAWVPPPPLRAALMTLAAVPGCAGGAAGDDDVSAAGDDDVSAAGDDDSGLADDDTSPAGDDDTTPGDDDTSGQPWLDGDCDPLVPSQCGLPFPSDAWLEVDPTTVSGRRVALGETTLPETAWGTRTSPEVLRHSDGWSPGGSLLTHLPGATATGLPDPQHMADSLSADCPTVLLDTGTGERIAHFAELDMSANQDDRRALMVRPAARLADQRRYIVAIRGVVDAAGVPVEPSPAFRALRDEESSDEVSVERRRAHYDDLFGRLAAAGVPRGDLQIAWDFTTASRENNTGRLLKMRDDSLEAWPEGAPYTIDSVSDAWSEHVARRIEGRITVPLYLDQPGPGGRMVLDDAGAPVQNGTADYPFLVLIPWSATTGTPVPLVQYGHGLFGSRYTADSEVYQEMLDEYGYTLFAIDWFGMSSEDVMILAEAAASGDADLFRSVPDRGQQCFLTMVLLLRTMTHGFADDPAALWEGQPLIDTTRRYYLGGSQGGIYGATYMAITPDIERGALAVPGMAYSLMLPRSVLYDKFAAALGLAYPDPVHRQMALGLVQMLWDRAEPDGYAPYITGDPLPGTPEHQVLILEAIGDHQVPNLASELLARTLGARQLSPGNRVLYGIESADGPYSGSAFIDYDFGLPDVPITNVPMREGEDPHGKVIDLLAVRLAVDSFWRTGVAETFCDGPCDPE